MSASPKTWASDRELVDQILSGSQSDFNQLYDAYFNRVYRFALKRLRDKAEAEDVAQEVFMTLLTALPSYQGQSSLLVWIFGITRNKVNRRFRRPRLLLASACPQVSVLARIASTSPFRPEHSEWMATPRAGSSAG